MTRPTAYTPTPGDSLDRYGCDLAWHAAQVIEAVWDLGPAVVQARIADALAMPTPDGKDPVAALVVTLAAAINPDKFLANLDWVRALEPSDQHQAMLTLAGQPRTPLVSEQLVRAIRREAATGRGYADIGRECGIKRNYVREIVLRKVWAHLDDAGPEQASA